MKIGFIGLGIMGESMCENIVKKHDDKVYCFDFIKEKVDLLASKGAVPCENSVELAKQSDVVIEFVVEDIFKSAEFYKKYLGFEIEFTEYKPTSWMQLKNGNTRIKRHI